jgi:hypothetical protein
LSNASLQPTTATRESIVAYLDDISQDESKFALFMKGFFDRSLFDMKRKNIETIRLDYLNSMKTNNSNRIGIVFYPIMVDVANGLNSQYQSILTKYAQIATAIKQVYLKISIKDSLYTFITQPFSTANFAFEQKGSMTNPFNANLGIVVKK